MMGMGILALLVMMVLFAIVGFRAATKERAICNHKWKTVGSYASLKDMDPNDQSGFVDKSQQCVLCQIKRRYREVFDKDGSIEKVEIVYLAD